MFATFLCRWREGIVGISNIPILDDQTARGLVPGDVDPELYDAMKHSTVSIALDFVLLEYVVHDLKGCNGTSTVPHLRSGIWGECLPWDHLLAPGGDTSG